MEKKWNFIAISQNELEDICQNNIVMVNLIIKLFIINDYPNVMFMINTFMMLSLLTTMMMVRTTMTMSMTMMMRWFSSAVHKDSLKEQMLFVPILFLFGTSAKQMECTSGAI